MGIMDKLAFWRKEPELPDVKGESIDSGFKGPGGSLEAGIGKPKDDWSQQQQGAESGFDQLGLGKQGDLSQQQEQAPSGGIEPGYGGGPGEPAFKREAPDKQQNRWQRPHAPMTPMQPTESKEVTRDFEVLSAKLDTLKATLDGINQRLTNLERMAQEKRRW